MVLLLTSLFLTHSANAQDNFDKIFVTQEWLLEHLDDDNLVLLHVMGRDEYPKGHIQGAQLIDREEFVVDVGGLRWELPPVDKLDSTFRSKGITNSTINVLCFGYDVFAPAFRLYFTMEYAGLADNTFVLDGGLPGWKSKGLDLTTEVPEVKPTPPGELVLTPDPTVFAKKEEVSGRTAEEGTTIIDARRENFYTGETDGDGYYQRSGHIPGSKNITWLDLFDEGNFLKSRDVIAEYYSNAGVNRSDDVITYCHVGLRATVLYTISKAMGHKVQLYDGSFTEWEKSGDDYLVETGKQ